MSWDDAELERVLCNGYLSGRKYDEVFERVVEQVASATAAPERAPRWLKRARLGWWFPATASVAAAAAAIVWLSGQHASSTGPEAVSPDKNMGEFVAKGASLRETATLSGVLDAGCEHPDPHACRQGDTLMFSVNTGVAAGYVGAYAERVAAPGDRIWYFPSRDDPAPRVEPGTGTRVLPTGVALLMPHAPGRYRVTLWLSRTPVTRTGISEGDLVAKDEVLIEVTP